MKVFSFLFLISVYSTILNGQISLGFSKSNAFSSVSSISPDDTILSISIVDKKPKLRIGVSMQRNAFVELGIAYNTIKSKTIESSKSFDSNSRSSSTYASFEFQLIDDNRIYGPKVGFETLKMNSIVSLISGLEATYYFDNKNSCLALTPKLGISILFMDLYYGYNFMFNNKIPEINNHKFGITVTVLNVHYKDARKVK